MKDGTCASISTTMPTLPPRKMPASWQAFYRQAHKQAPREGALEILYSFEVDAKLLRHFAVDLEHRLPGVGRMEFACPRPLQEPVRHLPALFPQIKAVDI